MSSHPSNKRVEPQRGRFQIWPLLVAITLGIHVSILLGPDYIPVFRSWKPIVGTTIVLVVPTLWGLFLFLRYRAFPERMVAFGALAGAGFWWMCWIVSHWLRP